MPDAIIFDIDGTLIDTEWVWDVVRRGLADEAGVAWPDGATQAMMGMSTPNGRGSSPTRWGCPIRLRNPSDAPSRDARALPGGGHASSRRVGGRAPDG
ncbi:HAD family hydrolase [Tessaracoccus coleopterorum]|uniref:hypothetical protein n=1 Tax=Tessaracoccus coleopterorum TaxID=2714950 RepID=UPI0018D40FC0|nr:hypothetical protein [Tessaracoccus coleopterorum]